MKLSVTKKVVSGAGAVLLASCVSVPRDAGVSNVQREVGARTNQKVEMRPAAVTTDDQRVQALLQGQLDADKAVAVALLNNPRVQVELSNLGLARADLLDASTIRNPILGAEIRFPGDPVRPYELTVTQSLLDLIQLRRRRGAGQAAFQAAEARVSASVLGIAADVRADFYELEASAQRLSIDRTIAESARTSAELAQRQHDAGNITDLDLESAQTTYEQAKLDLARSEEDVLVRREVLIRDMGLRNANVDWKIPDSFPQPPGAEPTDAELQQLLAQRRLDVVALQREIEANQRLLPAARTGALGEIDAGVHRERDAEGPTTTGPSLTVPIPIFNRGAAARARAEARLLRAQQQLASVLVSAGSEARAARQIVLAARARADYYRDVVLPRRKRILDLTQVEQNAMVTGIFQLLQAKQNEAIARRNYIDAQRDYWIARTNLDRALNGTPTEAVGGFVPMSGVAQTDSERRGGAR